MTSFPEYTTSFSPNDLIGVVFQLGLYMNYINKLIAKKSIRVRKKHVLSDCVRIDN